MRARAAAGDGFVEQDAHEIHVGGVRRRRTDDPAAADLDSRAHALLEATFYRPFEADGATSAAAYIADLI
jgi:hypothetical protein